MNRNIAIFSTFILLMASMDVCSAFENPMKVLFKGQKHPTINENKLTPRKRLGFFLFFDKNLSTPPGQSCGTCHDPQHGFEDIE